MDFGFDNIQGSIQDITGQLESLDQRLNGATGSQLQTIQDSLKGLDQLQDIQSTLDQLDVERESRGVDPWVVVVITVVVALLTLSLGLVAGIRFALGVPRQ
ncbi:MAG: hypothetical protein HW388_1201 [Dehalococcoidia bacterium]|nr:hypothetical protein [Dehalococcoidia bacterium]